MTTAPVRLATAGAEPSDDVQAIQHERWMGEHLEPVLDPTGGLDLLERSV